MNCSDSYVVFIFTKKNCYTLNFKLKGLKSSTFSILFIDEEMGLCSYMTC